MKSKRGVAETIRSFEVANGGAAGIHALFQYADALRRVGRCCDALKAYQELESRDIPDSSKGRVFVYKGKTLEEMGRFRDAEAAFAEACRLEDSTVPCVYLAGVLAAQERFEDAIAVLHDAMNREGDRDEVLLNMALNQRALGRLDEAKRSLESALALSPDYPEAQARLADVQAALAIVPVLDSASQNSRG